MENEFKTRDMALAACFMVDGIRYLRVEKDEEDSRRLIFVFEPHSDIERIQRERANATHVASTVAYDECLRRLKSIIHGF
jgi:hypothetical protein